MNALFKRNLHIARRIKLNGVNKEIENYPKQYQTPKYLLFIKTMIENGSKVKIYKAGVSKYVFVITDTDTYKIRFSNHRPIFSKEIEEDCDFYVGVSHRNCQTTEEIINIIQYKEIIKKI